MHFNQVDSINSVLVIRSIDLLVVGSIDSLVLRSIVRPVARMATDRDLLVTKATGILEKPLDWTSWLCLKKSSAKRRYWRSKQKSRKRSKFGSFTQELRRIRRSQSLISKTSTFEDMSFGSKCTQYRMLSGARKRKR